MVAKPCKQGNQLQEKTRFSDSYFLDIYFSTAVDNPIFRYSTVIWPTYGVKTIGTEHHRALIGLLVQKRENAKLRQSDIAKRMRQYQSWVARIESGQRRVDVVEFFQLAQVIGFDAHKALRKIFR